MKIALIDELCAQHYERVGPLLEASLGRIPVASASFPNGFDKPAQWHVGLHDPPPAVATVQAATPSGTHSVWTDDSHSAVVILKEVVLRAREHCVELRARRKRPDHA
jgi:DNA primase